LEAIFLSEEPQQKVTVADIQSTWASLIGQSKNESTINSDAGSASIDSQDFEGFELVQVLRLMIQLEDHLSFLSFKVHDYLKKV